MQTVGFKLIDTDTEEVVNQWGGIWGQCPGKPNPLILPNGNQVHGASVGFDYSGYMLIEWQMEEPAPAVPESVTPRQVRLLLLQQDLLDDVETMILTQPKEIQIAWEYALEFQRNDPLLNTLAQNLNLTEQQLDEFFIAAAQL